MLKLGTATAQCRVVNFSTSVAEDRSIASGARKSSRLSSPVLSSSLEEKQKDHSQRSLKMDIADTQVEGEGAGHSKLVPVKKEVY